MMTTATVRLNLSSVKTEDLISELKERIENADLFYDFSNKTKEVKNELNSCLDQSNLFITDFEKFIK
jgi:hypothetical protein